MNNEKTITAMVCAIDGVRAVHFCNGQGDVWYQLPCRCQDAEGVIKVMAQENMASKVTKVEVLRSGNNASGGYVDFKVTYLSQ